MDSVDNFQDIPFNIDFSLLDGILYSVYRFSSTIFGFIAVVLAIYTTVITVFDIMYVSFPIFQDFVIRKRLGYVDDSKLRIKIISRDAYYAVEEKYKLDGTQGKNYNSTMAIYLRRRGITYLRLGIIFFLLIGGPRIVVPTLSKALEPLFKAFGILN